MQIKYRITVANFAEASARALRPVQIFGAIILVASVSVAITNREGVTQNPIPIALGLVDHSASSGATSNVASDMYVDRNLPGDIARVFAPGVVSFSRGEGIYSERPVFSPDFRECYFDVTDYKNKKFTTFFTRYENGAWTKPEPAFFVARGGSQSAFSSDGQTLLFVAPSPQDAKVAGIWRAKRTVHGWSEPKFLDAPVDDGSDARFPGLTANGTLYYLCTTKVGDKNRSGVCRAKPKNGRYESVEKIDKLQSGDGVIMGDFYVSPDERYIIIYSTLPDNLGQGDLYVSFRGKDDGWSSLSNLGSAVNTKGYDFAPSVTPDGHFIFFTRDRGGQGDVYWISAKILDGLKK